MNKTPNMLMEWNVLNEEDTNRIKLYVEQRGNALYLFLLTKLAALGLDDLKGYEIKASIEQLKKLPAGEALKLYYKAEKQAKGE